MSGYVQNNMPYYDFVDFGAPNGSLFFTNLIFAGIKKWYKGALSKFLIQNQRKA